MRMFTLSLYWASTMHYNTTHIQWSVFSGCLQLLCGHYSFGLHWGMPSQDAKHLPIVIPCTQCPGVDGRSHTLSNNWFLPGPHHLLQSRGLCGYHHSHLWGWTLDYAFWKWPPPTHRSPSQAASTGRDVDRIHARFKPIIHSELSVLMLVTHLEEKVDYGHSIAAVRQGNSTQSVAWST